MVVSHPRGCEPSITQSEARGLGSPNLTLKAWIAANLQSMLEGRMSWVQKSVDSCRAGHGVDVVAYCWRRKANHNSFCKRSDHLLSGLQLEVATPCGEGFSLLGNLSGKYPGCPSWSCVLVISRSN